MQKSPPPFIWACPEEKNILDCELPLISPAERGSLACYLQGISSSSALHCTRLMSKLTYAQRGPPDTPYAGGEYHGLIWFPSDYRQLPYLVYRVIAERDFLLALHSLQTARRQDVHPFWEV